MCHYGCYVALTWNIDDLIPPSERYIHNFSSKQELNLEVALVFRFSIRRFIISCFRDHKCRKETKWYWLGSLSSHQICTIHNPYFICVLFSLEICLWMLRRVQRKNAQLRPLGFSLPRKPIMTQMLFCYFLITYLNPFNNSCYSNLTHLLQKY
ncbi:hypothetical protein Hanom_Chr03g00272371 [Helianthus anomalus]